MALLLLAVLAGWIGGRVKRRSADSAAPGATSGPFAFGGLREPAISRWALLRRIKLADVIPQVRYSAWMDVSKIPTGKAPPQDINVVVEIPQGSAVKYEVDKVSGAIFVDRFLFTATAYPSAYGFIPGTLAEDGDPADALVLIPAQVVPGAVIRSRPIGMLKMEDEAGPDEKIVCVPHERVHPQYAHVDSIDDLPRDHAGGDRALLRAV